MKKIQQQVNQYGLPSNQSSQVGSLSNLNFGSQNRVKSAKNLSESCKDFKFFQKELISPLATARGVKYTTPSGSQSNMFSNKKSDAKIKQMKKIDNELKEYQKMKKEVITQTLTSQNEPFREKYNIKVKQEPSEWEEMKKQRILDGKRELNRKFKIQKQAITQYLDGQKVDNKIIKHHKEVVMPSPVQRAHHVQTKPNQDIFSMTQQAPASQTQRFYLQSQKQLMQQQEHIQQLKQFTALHDAKSRPKSALITMLDPSNLKTSKKSKEIDPIKIKMKEYLERFLKNEQQYFKILEDTSKNGQQFFQKSMDISQKFYYDQIEPSEYQFNQSSDLKTSKRYRILRVEQFKLNLPQHMPNYSNVEETQTKKKLGKNSMLKHSFTKVIDEQLMKDEKFLAMENYENYDSENYYGEQIKKQRIGLEQLYHKLLQTKEGFEKNLNIPQDHQDFISIVKQNNKKLVQLQIEINPKLVNEAIDHLGQTPLHLAAKRGYKKMALMLINKGANMQAVDLNGKTPLDLAIFHQQTKTISLIKKEEAFLKAEKQATQNQDENSNTLISYQDEEGLQSPNQNQMLLQIPKQVISTIEINNSQIQQAQQ